MIMRIGPVSPRRTEDAHHLESIKWFCQYVIRSQVQGFCPEVFICQPGTDDQDRRIGKKQNVIQQVAPGTRRKVTLGYHEWNSDLM